MVCPHCKANDGGVGYEKGTGLSNGMGQWKCSHCGWVEYDNHGRKYTLQRIQTGYWKQKVGRPKK